MLQSTAPFSSHVQFDQIVPHISGNHYLAIQKARVAAVGLKAQVLDLKLDDRRVLNFWGDANLQ